SSHRSRRGCIGPRRRRRRGSFRRRALVGNSICGRMWGTFWRRCSLRRRRWIWMGGWERRRAEGEEGKKGKEEEKMLDGGGIPYTLGERYRQEETGRAQKDV